MEAPEGKRPDTLKIAFYLGRNGGRASALCKAWKSGLAKHGLDLVVKNESEYVRPDADVAVFYGLAGNLKRAMREYPAAGATAVLIDLGYWGRVLNGDKLAGYHRISVNALHATDYFQKVKHPSDRWGKLNIRTHPFRRGGRHILLAGMSEKAAWVYDLDPQQWEGYAASLLRQHSRRPIWYRPKPSWLEASPIPGTEWKRAKPSDPLPLHHCWSLVSHHSHAALDALIAGVPVYCADGIARPLSVGGLTEIEKPLYPSEEARDQLMFDAAYTQYTPREIAHGVAWEYLRTEGLV